MTDERESLIRFRLECAHEAMLDAESLIDAGRWRGAANRLYYAAFYAVVALLLTDELHSRKHSGVRALFMRHYGNSGRFEPELARIYKWLYDTRMNSDYSDMYDVEPDEIRSAVEPTRALIARAEALTEEKL